MIFTDDVNDRRTIPKITHILSFRFSFDGHKQVNDWISELFRWYLLAVVRKALEVWIIFSTLNIKVYSNRDDVQFEISSDLSLQSILKYAIVIFFLFLSPSVSFFTFERINILLKFSDFSHIKAILYFNWFTLQILIRYPWNRYADCTGLITVIRRCYQNACRILQ